MAVSKTRNEALNNEPTGWPSDVYKEVVFWIPFSAVMFFNLSEQFYQFSFFCMLKLEFRLLMRRKLSLMLAILSGSSLMTWHDSRGIFSSWRSAWVVNISAIANIHRKWTWRSSWGELRDFWSLISLDLFLKAKPICLTKSKQVQKSTHHPAWCVPNSSLALGLWHHKGTWMEYWERVGKCSVTLGTEQAVSVLCSLCPLPIQAVGGGETDTQLAIRWLQFQAWLCSSLVVWYRASHLSYNIILSGLAQA